MLLKLGKCFVVLLLISLLVGCTIEDYGYMFHFDVEEGNGEIAIKDEISNNRIRLCNDEPKWCELDCGKSSKVAMLLGGKNGSRVLTFIAIPNDGFQVKEWIFNGEVVEGNKTTSYKAVATSEDNYNCVIHVVFEEIEG